jgi:hypothetical protein
VAIVGAVPVPGADLAVHAQHRAGSKEYVTARPSLLASVQALSTAVSAADVRVRDTGMLKDDFDERLTIYTPDEIWTFDLAFDVIAMLGALDVVQGETRALVISNMKSLDQQATGHTWKKELDKAGNGPAQFQELRTFVPRHSPHSHPGWR